MNSSPYLSAFSAPGRADSLGRLHQNLANLDAQLCQAVAEAVGQAAAGAARQAVLSLVRLPGDHSAPARLSSRGLGGSPSLWDGPQGAEEPDQRPWSGGLHSPWLPEEDEEDEEDDLPGLLPPSVSPRRCPWRQALAAACHAVAWWSRRQAGRSPGWAALGFGLACGLALYTGEATAGSGAGLVLLLLADAVGALVSVRAAPEMP